MQVTLSRTEGQGYYRSSSFKMAVLFTALLTPCVVILAYFAFVFYRDVQTFFWLCIFCIFSMLAVIIVSFFISIFVVSRTNRIAGTAREIMDTGNLSQRIELDSRWDDLSYLSSVLNTFLERNQDLVEGVKRVSDNIAHDLRTPLTRMRNNLETMKKKSTGEVAESTDALIAEADHLLSTFNALLRIARIEAAQQRNFLPVQLDDIMRDVVELYEPLAEEKKITLSLSLEKSAYVGDKNLLFQVFANLLDNAIKFSPVASQVVISIKKKDAVITCTMTDAGPGVPEGEREKIFDRFYRSEQSRTTQGNGLGLSLVQAVIDLHGGRIVLEDARPGLIVKITFI